MSWQIFSIHFRQTYEGGYRYLDHSGDLITFAEAEHDLMLSEVQTSGLKLEKPESGIIIKIDAGEIVMSQDFPADGGEEFLHMSEVIVDLVTNFYSPGRVNFNIYGLKFYWPLKTSEAALASSVKIGDKYHESLGDLIGMVPNEKNQTFVFDSGSMEARVVIQAVSVENAVFQHRMPGLRDTDFQKRRVARQNAKADRLPTGLQQGMMLEVYMKEHSPPPKVLAELFERLAVCSEKLKGAIVVK